MSDLCLLLRTAPPLSREQLEHRAKRIQRKIASWDREKLETYYVRNLLSALLLQRSQRALNQALPVLAAMAEQKTKYKELRKTARVIALYANMLFKPELARHQGYRKGGRKAARTKKTEAQRRHDQWLIAYKRLTASGTAPRYIAGKLAPKYRVSPRAIREGIKEALQRANHGDRK
jgi:hypothetical protein